MTADMPARAEALQRPVGALPRIAIILAAALAIATGVAHHFQVRALSAISDAQSQQLARHVAGTVHDDVAATDRVGLANRLETLNAFRSLRSATITDRQGRAMAAVRRNAAGNLSATPAAQADIPGGPEPGERASRTLISIAPERVVWQAIGEIAPIGWVRLEIDTGEARAASAEALAHAIGVAAGLWIACVAAAWGALRSGRPRRDAQG